VPDARKGIRPKNDDGWKLNHNQVKEVCEISAEIAALIKRAVDAKLSGAVFAFVVHELGKSGIGANKIISMATGILRGANRMLAKRNHTKDVRAP
jgi:hypothetical protein